MRNPVRCRGRYSLALNILELATLLGVVVSSPTDGDVRSSSLRPRLAADILRRMNTDVAPCDDFYQFACGNYANTARTAPDMITEIFNRVQSELWTIVLTPQPKLMAAHYHLPYNLFTICQSETLKKERDNLNDFLRKQLVEMEMLRHVEKWTPEMWNVTQVELHRLGISTDYLVKVGVDIDSMDEDRRTIAISYPSVVVNRSLIVNRTADSSFSLYSSYYEQMVNKMKGLGVGEPAAKGAMSEALKFEIQLANISNNDQWIGRVRLGQLESDYPQLPWAPLVNSLLAGEEMMSPTDTLDVKVSPRFLNELFNLLDKTGPRQVVDYLMGRFLVDISAFLPGRGRPTPQQCYDLVISSLGPAVSALYMRKHFSKKTRRNLEKMSHSLTDVFKKNFLRDEMWLNNKTRMKVEKELDRLTAHIGYPPQLTSDKYMKKYYNDLNIKPDSMLFETRLHIAKFQTMKNFAAVRQRHTAMEEIASIPPYFISPGYNRKHNVIYVPATILRGSFYDHRQPAFMNYGIIGSIIGHDYTHAFVLPDAYFDVDDHNINWWPGETSRRFAKKKECLINQYANSMDKDTGEQLNAEAALTAIIADYGGFKASYLAYMNWTQQPRTIEHPLPGLQHYNASQMFWISAAQAFCIDSTNERLRMITKTNQYLPPRDRVTVPFRNIEEFAMDFNCPSGSDMNPPSKCKIW